MTSPSTVLHIDGYGLTLEDVAKVAYATPGTLEVQLSESALTAMQASRKVVDGVVERAETVYGITTGFGAMSSVTIPPEEVEALQLNLVRSHSVGMGEPLEIPVVRAMMLLRANTLAKGFSGIRPEVVQTLLAMLNQGVHPVIPRKGSLGASGDLAPLGHLALVLIGEGEAWQEDTAGQRSKIPGAQAMQHAGITPVVLKAKEGLALLNGTQYMSALGVLTLLEAEQLLDIADLAGAMTIEAIHGSIKPFDAGVASLRQHPGHARSAELMRALLANSEIMASHRDCAKVQDPYSLRCIPQVHGASRDALSHLRNVLSIEINSVTDNPLVFPDGLVVSQGNFHGQPLSMALDYAAMAIAEIGSIAERRLDKLMNPVFSNLPPFLVGGKEGLSSGLMILHYTTASLVSENKVLAHPACVDSIPTSNDKEDHVSMGATAALKLRSILENTRWILAAELLAAAQGLEHRGSLKPGKGVSVAYQWIRERIPALTDDRSLSHEVAELTRCLASGELHQQLQSFL